MTHMLEVIKNTIELVKQSYFIFWGTTSNAALFYVALLYIFLCLQKKETVDKKLDMAILWLMVAVAFITVCPFSAWFIVKYCVESTVYRRMFWMLQVSLLIGYAGTKLIFQEEFKSRKWINGIVVAVIIGVCGINMYAYGAFLKAENPYKLWNGIPEVCEAIESDAKANGIEEIRVIGGADEFAVQARQYSGAIHMPYGRNGVRGQKLGKKATKIYEALHNVNGVDVKTLASQAKKGNYQYLVYYAQENVLDTFAEGGYEWLMQVEGYYIFKLRF